MNNNFDIDIVIVFSDISIPSPYKHEKYESIQWDGKEFENSYNMYIYITLHTITLYMSFYKLSIKHIL